MSVNCNEIDRKWQELWTRARLWEAEPNQRPKFYLTVAYPYVSGPMHLGHARTYLIPDVIARYKRMKGFNVLFPMAYHFTGTPIVGAAKRVRDRDPQMISMLKRFGVKEEELKKLEDPMYFANYWARISELGYRKGMELLGLSIDWRREFTTVDPHYKKFITWQYHKLWERGLIVKGKHPVKWCPSCKNPVTDHDLLEGEGVEILEFTLIKYRQGDLIFPAATLRPETLFGLTNIWLNPKAKYVIATVNGEKWVVSEQAVEKLREQGNEVEVEEEYQSNFGSEVEVPLTGKKVPILPAEFVNPNSCTGVVGSVPAHAPYDYVALRDLEQDEKWGELAKLLKPISLIELPGYGECPAVEVVNRMGIKNQKDPRLEDATREVYREEFARGKMRDWTGEYAGLAVSEAKLRVKEDLLRSGNGALMYEFSQLPVTCRCGTACRIKMVDDQWFLNYADPQWKELARNAFSRMKLLPPETRAQYEFVVNWLHEWPCTRKVGLGTPAPWTEGWIIESLSDSTIYMAYYTISHLLKQVEPEKLDDEIFDFIFWGKGNAEELGKRKGIPVELLEKMKREFDYWYPLNYRISAYELIPNHLTFFVFHHSLLFPHKLPEGILALGMVMLEGRKMSSSKGWLVTIPEAVQRYGADGVRLYLLSGSEPWQDFNWREKEAASICRNLQRFASLVETCLSLPEGEETNLDRWLLSRFQRIVGVVGEAMENFETRKALHAAFFEAMKDIERYLERGGKGKVLKQIVRTWLVLLSPFLPHVCEELWSKMERGFVCQQKWPEPRKELIDQTAEAMEEYLELVLQDVKEILQVLGRKPKLICLYVASSWKREILKGAIEGLGFEKLLQIAEKRVLKPEAAAFVKKIQKEIKQMNPDIVRASLQIAEEEYLKQNLDYLQRKLGAEVRVYSEEDPEKYDPAGRSSKATPLKPAIYLE
jgi:leucyl-tRNA synthetase